MWVYDQPPRAPDLIAALPSAEEVHTETEAETEAKAAPDGRVLKPDKPRRAAGQAARDCRWLAVAYLLGTAAAGALQALCGEGQREALSYFLERWRELFILSGAQDAARLFGCEYFAEVAVFTVLLFLGLSALGALPVFFFVMLYGTGCGLLASQLLGQLTPGLLAAYVLVAGVPLSIAAGCVCVFGASAVGVCSRLRELSFGRRAAALTGGVSARRLVGQYVLFVISLAPVCGAATALAYAANELQIW